MSGPAPAGRPLRVGLVGYGLAGAVFHAPLLKATPGMELVAVVTRDPGRQAKSRADNPGAEVLDSTAALWERAGELDLVVVATPTGTHVDVAIEGVARGLALVVDKPIAPTAVEARRVAEAAKTAGTFLSVFQNRRWDSDTLTIQRLLAGGDLGTVMRFESRFERWRPEARAGAWREEVAPSEGGGILLDLGSHLVDQALHLLGPAARVYAEIAKRRPNSVEDDAFIALTHRTGATSHLWVSAVAALQGPRVRVLGTAGAYVQPHLDAQEEALRSGMAAGTSGWGREPVENWGLLATRDQTQTIEPVAGNWPAYYAGVAAALRGITGANPVTAESALAVLEVLDATRASARAGQVVTMPGP